MESRPDPSGRPPRHGLRVRCEAVVLAAAVFDATDRMPDGRRAAFADQMRRAAVSLNANLAEGEARDTPRDRLRVFSIAWAELRELTAHIELAGAVRALPEPEAARLVAHCRHVGRMLYALRRAVAERAKRKPHDR